jgi:hypothetical protein
VRPRVRPLSFADYELQAQGVALDATLQALADFLDAPEELVTLVHADLVRELKRPQTGRDGLSAVQVLRAFVLQRVKAWDLRELRERIADGYTLRIFTTFDAAPVPKHDAFHRAFCRLTPATVRALNHAVVQAAVTLGLEDGAQLRVDTTVVATDIHWPTDSTLLWDAVRVITRLVKRLGEHVPSALRGFADHTRRARRRMQEISRLTSAERPRQQTRKYRDLLEVTAGVVTTARAAGATARAAQPSEPLGAARVTGVCDDIEHFCGLADRVIAQTRRRVLEGQDRTARRAREESGIQGRAALPRRHRGPHLSPPARPWHAALPARGAGAVRGVRGRGGAGEQPAADRRSPGPARDAPATRRVAAAGRADRVRARRSPSPTSTWHPRSSTCSSWPGGPAHASFRRAVVHTRIISSGWCATIS